MIVAIAAIFVVRFPLRTQYVAQTYLQSAKDLQRDIYLKTSLEIQFGCERLLKLLKACYGLGDAGNYWQNTAGQHMSSNLGMVSAAGNLSLLFKATNEEARGTIGIYVDNKIGDVSENSCKGSKLM